MFVLVTLMSLFSLLSGFAKILVLQNPKMVIVEEQGILQILPFYSLALSERRKPADKVMVTSLVIGLVI